MVFPAGGLSADKKAPYYFGVVNKPSLCGMETETVKRKMELESVLLKLYEGGNLNNDEIEFLVGLIDQKEINLLHRVTKCLPRTKRVDYEKKIGRNV